ncbi:unnamed protein product [Sphenostylis stenocarpa]|uniref:Uncharacterized protein n=1 Tax=Sphenostylis stenocarpa TaxID=92480 RepID=A0AA86S3D3_9FABA|nr:unnamed protein product [Sphenostylis stenocarpa]
MKGRICLKTKEKGVECVKDGEIDNGQEREGSRPKLISEGRWKILRENRKDAKGICEKGMGQQDNGLSICLEDPLGGKDRAMKSEKHLNRTFMTLNRQLINPQFIDLILIYLGRLLDFHVINPRETPLANKSEEPFSILITPASRFHSSLQFAISIPKLKP